MDALVLGGVAFVAMVLLFGLAALVVTQSHRSPGPERVVPEPSEGDPAETMARVLGELERLAVLRDQGVLTAKEFTNQKTKLLADERPA
jgi:hypothetical protein